MLPCSPPRTHNRLDNVQGLAKGVFKVVSIGFVSDSVFSVAVDIVDIAVPPLVAVVRVARVVTRVVGWLGVVKLDVRRVIKESVVTAMEYHNNFNIATSAHTLEADEGNGCRWEVYPNE